MLTSVYEFDELTPHIDLYLPFLGMLMITRTCVEDIALMPALMALTRIQASLLLGDEKIIVSIDEALRGNKKSGESEAIGLKEAWRTFGWDAWRRLGMLYGQVL